MRSWRSTPASLRAGAIAVAAGAVYLLLARLGLLLVAEPEGIAVVWPLTGLAAVAIVLAPARDRAALAAAVPAGVAVANLWAGASWGVALGFAAANAAGALLAAAVILAVGGSRTPLVGTRGAISLTASALAGPCVAGLAGAAVAAGTLGAPFADAWRLWWVADAVGIVVMGAAVVAWNGRRSSAGPLGPSVRAGLAVLATAVSAPLFLAPAVDPPALLAHTYPAVLLTVVLALSAGLVATVAGVLGVASMAVLGLAVGRGPFAAEGVGEPAHIIELQAFVVALLLTNLLIAVAAAARRDAEAELRAARRSSEALTANSPDVVARFDRGHRHLYVNAAVEGATGVPPESLIGRGLDLIGATPEAVEALGMALDATFEAGRVVEIELDYPGPGGPRIFHSRLAPETEPDGSVASVLVVSRDITERRSMEAELRDARDYTRALVESLNDAMFVVSVDGVMVDVNARAIELTGYSREELVGSRAPFPYHDDQAPPERLAVQERLLREGGSGEFDQSLIHRDGRRVEVVLSAAPLHGADGSVIGGVRLLRDVTAERAARRAYEASEARFRAFLEFAPDGVVITDSEGRIAVVNARIEEMFGHRREHLLGRRVEMLMPAAVRSAHAGHRAGYAASPGVRAMGQGRQLMGLRADGTEFPVDVSLSPLATDEGVMMAAAVRDVTERRAAETALRESEKRYRSLITGLADGVVVHSADSEIIDCNPAAERILGMTRAQLLKDAPRDPRWRTVRPDGSPYPLREHPAMRTLVSGEPVRGELIGVCLPDGGTRWISVSTEPLGAGARGAVVSSFTDVTERLDAERDQAARERLATLVASGADPREVFDAIAHEAAVLCGADACAVLRYTRGGSPAVVNGWWAGFPLSVPVHGVARPFGSESISAALLRAGRPVRLSAAAGDPVRSPVFGADVELDAAIAVPVRVEGDLWGAVIVGRLAGGTFAAVDEARVVGLADAATLAIVSAEARERLAVLATTDELTGLANRRSFLDRLRGECERVRRTGRPLALVMVDIDHFKEVNDRFGHPEGDRVLVAVAEAARGVTRAGEIVARVGGEEFALILPGVDAEGARSAGERLRAAVSRADAGRAGRVSVSVGVAQWSPESGESDAGLIVRADQALYRAKRAGRDRVVLDTGPAATFTV